MSVTFTTVERAAGERAQGDAVLIEGNIGDDAVVGGEGMEDDQVGGNDGDGGAVGGAGERDAGG